MVVTNSPTRLLVTGTTDDGTRVIALVVVVTLGRGGAHRGPLHVHRPHCSPAHGPHGWE